MRLGIRRAVGSVLVGSVVGAAALLGAGPVTADPLRPLPFLALSCAQDVVAFTGQPIILARLAVNGMVTKAIADTPGLGPLKATAVGLTFPFGVGIKVGEVPDGTTTITPRAIADAVVAQVRLIEEIASAVDTVAAKVSEQVVAACGMDVRALNPSRPGSTPPTTPPGATPPGTTPPGTTPPGTTPPAPGQPTASPGTPTGGATRLPPEQLHPRQPGAGTGTAPPRDHGGIPHASPDGVGRPSAGGPGHAPRFGIIGQDSAGVDVRTVAGDAQALPTGYTRSDGVGGPILLAALFLSVVTGALVRTWVLRES